MKIYGCIAELTEYAKKYLELNKQDESYVVNGILDLLGLSSYEKPQEVAVSDDVDALLNKFVQTADSEGIFPKEEGAYYCDKVMGMLSLMPAAVDKKFRSVYSKEGGSAAMQWLYDYSVRNNYVKKAALDKNPRFERDGLVVTINLSKPEFRDPKKAASGNSVKGGYPKCVICRENTGYAPRNKCNLRTVSITLDGKPWFWQYSPYGYFRQHGIAVNVEHTPMKVDRQTVINLMDFVDQFPRYFIGCNACLERIGGSVLSHDHYQGGGEILPLHNAAMKNLFVLPGYENLRIGELDWPGTAVRICGTDKAAIVHAAEVINQGWCNFTDESQGIVCRTEKGQHNAISPSVVKRGGEYELNIILRSNVTSEKYPDGVFHAHPEFHVIKKESIGLIEAQGLFILPGRLQRQLQEVEACISQGKPLDENLAEFAMVYDETKALARALDEKSVHIAMQQELASICRRILQNTAVFKDSDKLKAFMEGLGFEQ